MNINEFKEAFHASSMEEILYNFPSKYEKIEVTPFCLNPVDGQRLVYIGVPSKIQRINRGNGLIRFNLFTSNKNVSCLIINQVFYLNKLIKNESLLFVLYYSSARHVYVVNSIYDLDSIAAISGIKPVYSLPKGVSNSYFVNFLKRELCSPFSKSIGFKSLIPHKYVAKYHLLDEYTSLKHVHFPMNGEVLKQGLKTFKYKEALEYCINALLIKKKANNIKRQATSIDHKKINDFVSKLPYKLTKDQNTAIKDIILDLERDRVMYRLLQGDVGTGKTIVSFLACYGNFLRKKQTVYVAPTYELARQHFENAQKIFKNIPINISFLAGSTSAKDKKQIMVDLSKGTIDLLFSTHASLSSYIHFARLGLVIIDEQQLFGVDQRAELLKKGQGADLLMMSATPIPRTLSQIINSDIDVSLLETFPQGIRNVKTLLVRSTDVIIDKAIKKALAVGRQIFIVAPKIETGNNNSSNVNAIYEDMALRYGRDKCQLLHGKIKKEEQDKIYQTFLSGQKPILVSTTVIEVGIDVSKACLLIVYDANYFGLSTLHQLRGRIGRSGEFALALMIYDGDDKDSKAKLQFLCDNLDGLTIAQFDMEQRGTGSYGGENQSGKSELKVCNFVKDIEIFKCAKNDAIEIIENPNEKENALLLEDIAKKKTTYLV